MTAVTLRKRPLTAAVRYMLNLPPNAPDDDVIAELACVIMAAKMWSAIPGRNQPYASYLPDEDDCEDPDA